MRVPYFFHVAVYVRQGFEQVDTVRYVGPGDTVITMIRGVPGIGNVAEWLLRMTGKERWLSPNGEKDSRAEVFHLIHLTICI